MDPSSNFSSYRSTLKAAMWRSHGAKDQRQRIVIPFFSLLVKDLYFLNQGCSNKYLYLDKSSIFTLILKFLDFQMATLISKNFGNWRSRLPNLWLGNR